MSPSNRTEHIRTREGERFDGYLAIPESGRGPGLIVVQEIFGVTDYIKDTCQRLAGLGYVTLAPELYWRLEPGIVIEERSPDALNRAFQYRERLNFGQATEDAVDALQHLRRLPEVKDGRAGILGFCLGGGIAFAVAAAADPDTTVSYYGSAIPEALGQADAIKGPILFQFGGADQYLPPEQQEAIRAAFAGRENAEFHLHEGAGHAFDNRNAAMFHHPAAAVEAWAQTVEFLARTLPA